MRLVGASLVLTSLALLVAPLRAVQPSTAQQLQELGYDMPHFPSNARMMASRPRALGDAKGHSGAPGGLGEANGARSDGIPAAMYAGINPDAGFGLNNFPSHGGSQGGPVTTKVTNTLIEASRKAGIAANNLFHDALGDYKELKGAENGQVEKTLASDLNHLGEERYDQKNQAMLGQAIEKIVRATDHVNLREVNKVTAPVIKRVSNAMGEMVYGTAARHTSADPMLEYNAKKHSDELGALASGRELGETMKNGERKFPGWL